MTKTEARHDLGVRTIVDDANVYDQIKLLSRFIVLAGYSGLYVVLDEAVNLYKLTSTQARTSNYEHSCASSTTPCREASSISVSWSPEHRNS